MAGLLLRCHIAMDYRLDAARYSTVTCLPVRWQERDQVADSRAAGTRNEPALDLYALTSVNRQSINQAAVR